MESGREKDGDGRGERGIGKDLGRWWWCMGEDRRGVYIYIYKT